MLEDENQSEFLFIRQAGIQTQHRGGDCFNNTKCRNGYGVAHFKSSVGGRSVKGYKSLKNGLKKFLFVLKTTTPLLKS